MTLSPRARVAAIVAAAAAVAVTGTVTITWLQARGEPTSAAASSAPGSVGKPLAGVPPLAFDFGVRRDAEAQALTRGEQLLDSKTPDRAAALAIFRRYHSVEAEIGAAFARWPSGGLDTLKRLVAEHPRSATAQLHLGYALLWSGRNADAVKQLQRVDREFPDAPESVTSENVLYAKMAPNLPLIVLGLGLPSAPTAAAQLRILARDAAAGGADAKLRYGDALWTLHRRVSAERQFAAAAALAPRDPLARTLAAVGRFTKRNPVAAFSRLGPLTAVFPRSSAVQFHLGVLLLWTAEVAKGKKHLRSAVLYEPGSPWAKAARELLSALKTNGTK
jgi:tetratricopeptide (TPR) repeat protein